MASELWQRIRAVRKYMELNGDEFGALFGVTKSSVSQWESTSPKGRTQPEREKLMEMAKVSGAPVDWLMSDESDCDFQFWKDEPHPPAPATLDPPLVQPKTEATDTIKIPQFEEGVTHLRPLRMSQMNQIAVQFALSKYLPRGWEIYSEDRRFDLLLYDQAERMRCAIEIKSLRM